MKRKRMVVQVNFRPDEEYLFQGLLSMVKKTKQGRRWGVSDYIKTLIKYNLSYPENFEYEMLRETAYKEIYKWRCPICGTRGKVMYLFDEGDMLRIQLRCASNPCDHFLESIDSVWIRYPLDPKLKEEFKEWIQKLTGKTIQPYPPKPKPQTQQPQNQPQNKPSGGVRVGGYG